MASARSPSGFGLAEADQAAHAAGKTRGTRHRTTLATESLLDGEAEVLANIVKLVEAKDAVGLSADEILARRDIERPSNIMVIISRYYAEGRSGPEFVEGGQHIYVQFPPKLADFFEPVPESFEMAKEWQNAADEQSE